MVHTNFLLTFACSWCDNEMKIPIRASMNQVIKCSKCNAEFEVKASVISLTKRNIQQMKEGLAKNGFTENK